MFGLDHLGIAKYPKVARETYTEGLALGASGGVFGNSLPAIDKILIKGKCPAVRIHLAWRDDHGFSLRDLPGIIREAKRWVRMVKSIPK